MSMSERPQQISEDHGYLVRSLLDDRFDGEWYPTHAAAAAAAGPFGQVVRSDEQRLGWL